MSKAIVVNKHNRNIYTTLDGVKFDNLTTGASGTVTPDQARNSFNLPVIANVMIEKNQTILTLITKLNLSLEKGD